LDNNIKIHPLVKEVKSILDSLKRLTPGGAIYDFSLINSKKEYINTFDKRGQFLLVLFTINGCEYGKEMLEDLRKNYAELKKKKFDILEVNASINFEYNFKWIKNLEKIYNYPWEKVYLFDNKLGAKILRDYNMILFPRSFLYSRDGILIEVNPSSEKILMLLNKN
jgi:thioredoxin-related protein